MNKKFIYSVRDNLTFEYGLPLVYASEIDCLRAVCSQISSDKTKFEKGLISYDPDVQLSSTSLFSVGYFYENGTIEGFEPKLVCIMSDAPNLYQKLLTEFN